MTYSYAFYDYTKKKVSPLIRQSSTNSVIYIKMRYEWIYTNSIVHVPTSIRTVLLEEDDIVDWDRKGSTVPHPKFYDFSAKDHLLCNKETPF